MRKFVAQLAREKKTSRGCSEEEKVAGPLYVLSFRRKCCFQGSLVSADVYRKTNNVKITAIPTGAMMDRREGRHRIYLFFPKYCSSNKEIIDELIIRMNDNTYIYTIYYVYYVHFERNSKHVERFSLNSFEL